MLRHRRSIRLDGFDYRSARAYFVTACIVQRQCLFGEVVGEHITLSPAGSSHAKNGYTLPLFGKTSHWICL